MDCGVSLNCPLFLLSVLSCICVLSGGVLCVSVRRFWKDGEQC